MTSTPVVRERAATDVAACVALMAKTHRLSGYPAHWPLDPAGFLAPEAEIAAWVLDDGRGGVIGHASLHRAEGDPAFEPVSEMSERSSDEFAVVARVLVDPDAQGGGLGRRLMEAATAHAEALGKHALLDVLVTSDAAIGFYENLGWVRIGEVAIHLDRGLVLETYVYSAPGWPERSG